MKNLRIEIKWAVIFVVAGLAWMLFEKMMGWHDEYIGQHALYTNLFGIIAVAIYVLALWDKRKNFYDGSMTWRQGFVSGLIITVIVALLSPLSQYITSTFISPDYFSNMIEYTVETGRMSREQAEEYFSLSSYLIQAFFGALVMGTVTSAIVAWIIRNKKE